jgi:hypothetical protein
MTLSMGQPYPGAEAKESGLDGAKPGLCRAVGTVETVETVEAVEAVEAAPRRRFAGHQPPKMPIFRPVVDKQ